MKSLQVIFRSFSGCNLLLATTAFVLPTSFKTETPNLYFEVLWILVGTLFAGCLTRIMGRWIMMIPVLCMTAIGCSEFLPIETYQIMDMLRGLSAGIVYTANLLLIRRFVASKMRKNAIALSCAFRLLSGVVMPMTKELDEFYLGSILIGLSLLSGILIISCGMNKSTDREWDEYYESYFERHSKVSAEDDSHSVVDKIIYFLVVLGMRVPGLLLSNNVTKTIQLAFLQNFSPKVVSWYFTTTLACAVLLLMTAFNHPSSRNPPSLKYLIIPASCIAFVLLLVNAPLIYVYLQQHGGFSLMAIILINFLLDIVYSAGLFYLLDALLVQSDLSNVKIGFLIAIEIVALTAIERLLKESFFLALITLEGYYTLLTVLFLVPIVLYHKQLDSSR